MVRASQELARYVTSARFQDIPDHVVARTKDLILDHLGVAIFGSTTPWARIVTEVVTSEAAGAGSSIYLSGRKSIARSAALANGTMAHAFELDDTLVPFHPGAVVIPAALAIGELEHSSGQELVTAVLVAYEVMARVSSAIHDTKVIRLGHHLTGIIGAIGAAAAAGKLLELGDRKLVCALGVAANQPTGLMEFFKEGTMEKRLFPGKAAHDGIFSAMLAARGFTAASSSLDGEYGFCRVFDHEADLGLLTRNLGKTFALMETGIKPYACCRTIHPQIDCALKIADAHDVSPANVSEVVVYGSRTQASDQHAYYEVPDVMAAQYTIPYCIARALLHHKVWVDDFTPEAMSDPATLTLMRRIKVTYDSEVEQNKGMAKISVKLANGKTVTETARNTRGYPQNPLFENDLRTKFKTLGLMVLPQERVENIVRLVENLPGITDVAELADAMVARP